MSLEILAVAESECGSEGNQSRGDPLYRDNDRLRFLMRWLFAKHALEFCLAITHRGEDVIDVPGEYILLRLSGFGAAGEISLKDKGDDNIRDDGCDFA